MCGSFTSVPAVVNVMGGEVVGTIRIGGTGRTGNASLQYSEQRTNSKQLFPTVDLPNQ